MGENRLRLHEYIWDGSVRFDRWFQLFLMFVIPDWNDYHLFSSMFSDCIGTLILQLTVFKGA